MFLGECQSVIFPFWGRGWSLNYSFAGGIKLYINNIYKQYTFMVILRDSLNYKVNTMTPVGFKV